MQSEKLLPLSFAGTILESSYLPVFLKPSGTVLSATSKLITTSLGYVVVPQYAVVKATTDFSSAVLPELITETFWKRLWDWLKNGVSTLTRRKKLNEIKSQFNSFVQSAKDSYAEYEKRHEETLESIVSDIDVINRQKTLMKDYLLKKLFIVLSKRGINATFTDVSIEHIDLRKFPIKKSYDLIKEKQVELEKSQIQRSKPSVNSFFYLHPIVLCG